jgi:chemotaxis protein MotB
MSRKKKTAEHVNHERWLVSYADFITLLFAFFVVLFSSSQVDKRKVGKISMAIQEAFQQMGIFQTANSRIPMVTADPLPTENIQLIEGGRGMAGHGHMASPFDKIVGSPPSGNDMGTLQKQLTGALKQELQRHDVVVKPEREGLVISLREIGFFDSGSAELRPSSEAAVQRIAQMLSAQPNEIRIEGHTDNVPIHNAQFSSNWELSTARATEMIRLFITRYNISATRLSAAGYAEYHPVASNETAEGRAQNRRVDIVVLTAALGGEEGSKQKTVGSGQKAEGSRQWAVGSCDSRLPHSRVAGMRGRCRRYPDLSAFLCVLAPLRELLLLFPATLRDIIHIFERRRHTRQCRRHPYASAAS